MGKVVAEWEEDVEFCTIMSVVIPDVYLPAVGRTGTTSRAARNKMALVWIGYNHAAILEREVAGVKKAIDAMRDRAGRMREAAADPRPGRVRT